MSTNENTAIQFTIEELLKYSRQLSLEILGLEGQKKLKAASALCVGVGGIGSPVSLYLCAAGLGNIGLVDHDTIAESNLHRQVLYCEKDIGKFKVNSAKERLTSQNSHVTIKGYCEKLTPDNATKILSNYDIIIDGSDNYYTRYIVNDTCKMLDKPFISASVFQFSGQLAVFNYKGGPCYRCLYPKPLSPGVIPNCNESGVLGVVPGILGTLAANEVLKMILNVGNTLSGKLLSLDMFNLDIKMLKLEKLAACPACNGLFFENMPRERQDIMDNIDKNISAQQLHSMIVNMNTDTEIIDVRESWEHAIYAIPNSINIPLKELSNYRPANNTKNIVLYCKSGQRSMAALNFLEKAPYRNLYSLKEGVLGWAEAIDNKKIEY